MKIQSDGEVFDVTLADDGTLDTVLSVYSTLSNKTHECRFSDVLRLPNGDISAEEWDNLASQAIGHFRDCENQ